MEERGLDTIFRMINYKNNQGYYLLEKWSYVTKPDRIENWIRHLRRGVKFNATQRHAPCD